jgi:hypothetical protein
MFRRETMGSILATMYEGFLLNPNGPQGKEIRAQLGNRYCWIPSPHEFFFCRWHRLKAAGHTEHKSEPAADLGFPSTGADDSRLPVPVYEEAAMVERLPCEKDILQWPVGVRVDLLERQGLPYETLPDGRRVFFVPDVEQFGAFTATTWQRLVESAKLARPQLTAHAYEVCLGVLQLWKVVGPEMGRIRSLWTEGEPERAVFWEAIHKVDPSGRHRKFEQWIYYWARELYESPMKKFTPSKIAFQVLQEAIGLAPSSIESILRRDTKNRVRRRKS